MAIFWFDTVFLKRPLPLRCTYTFCYKTFCEKLRYIVNSLRSTMYLRSLGLYSFARFCFWQIFNPDTYMNSKCQNILHKHRIRKLVLRIWNEQKIRHSLTNKLKIRFLDFWLNFKWDTFLGVKSEPKVSPQATPLQKANLRRKIQRWFLNFMLTNACHKIQKKQPHLSPLQRVEIKLTLRPEFVWFFANE